MSRGVSSVAVRLDGVVLIGVSLIALIAQSVVSNDGMVMTIG